MSNVVIRKAQSADCARVLELMQELAVFEGYIHKFRVTVPKLGYYLFEQKSIEVLVATVEEDIEGILVYFFQPFTYDLCPWLVIKEFYVSTVYRGLGVGHELFNYARQEAAENKCSKIKWEVLTDNSKAQRFYVRHGAQIESDWRIMSIDIATDDQ
ncbi:GNAT family N-acetyltransferase [Alteromonas gilva]|uniref:GNAT family N-acetyltransferase n=1 Tax=Alteromonas gilva TaxID=2987522 RepID=A0ABT5L5H7_9ALTE|nr:GNAT family N-acetyltransferase [Alteromonas gilva]MDC8831621.1 GNAT family N-acetyltransferase [Alteromonas gilva]